MTSYDSMFYRNPLIKYMYHWIKYP